jgi:hypothetical protein
VWGDAAPRFAARCFILPSVGRAVHKPAMEFDVESLEIARHERLRGK